MKMCKAISLAEAKQQLLNLSRRAAGGARYALTNHGQPEAVIIGAKEYESLVAPTSRTNHRVIILAGTGGRRVRRGRVAAVSRLIKTVTAVGITRPVVVLDAPSALELKQLAPLAIALVITDNRCRGFAASLKRGIRFVAKTASTALILFATMPMVKKTTIEKLLTRHALATGKQIFLPTFHNRRGHPVLIDEKLFNTVLRMDPRWGMAPLIKKHRKQVEEVRVNDSSVIKKHEHR